MKLLRIAIICFTVGITVVSSVLLSGCTSMPESKIWQSKCAANTILAIVTVGRDHPTRGRCCKMGKTWHIQAEYKPGNEWIPLQVINWPLVKEGEIENDGTEETKLHYRTGKKVLMEYWTRLKD